MKEVSNNIDDSFDFPESRDFYQAINNIVIDQIRFPVHDSIVSNIMRKVDMFEIIFNLMNVTDEFKDVGVY